MNNINFKRTLVNGLFFALPLLAIFLLGLKIIGMIAKVIEPLADKVGIQNLFGAITLTILALLIFLLLCFILGVLLHARVLRNVNKQIEGFVYKFVPQLQELKTLAAADDESNFQKDWKTVLLQEDEHWIPAYITNENANWLSIFMPDAPEAKSGSMKLVKKSACRFVAVDGVKFLAMLQHYGMSMPEAMGSEAAG